MIIFLGADHAGFELKSQLKPFLRDLGFEVNDEGAFSYDENDDYPDFVSIVAKQVQSDPDNHRGIVIGGSGQGEAITANRFAKIRAVVYYSSALEIIRLSRLHNNANILSLGARFISLAEAKEALKVWLATDFQNEDRHERRNQKIDGGFQTLPKF
ncbi:MAG: ribose-5-phosphate isomerase [Candidatus Vogelbacteria bacterium CG22_combo_CG10-13_8_21_14_all_37_9]|uniref:Ribose-5-phosphate isomerase n=1 Tax=Candidatus Vogelbacteria bacterium CG22_combo_CG10-13_8_21_14_all_37_9 TaxID=1975046 RepID=A0A2H0BL79_9BACT|nr:MAG: ribose-5-phosphate isomerase [bacterium CG10_37_50]PIP58381.1 MAG: ribose-5-phosphate isomerase [Candidatus Vogelbacteria bacterium CG22_combo_CG10-13_8_21_14_all_37_9]